MTLKKSLHSEGFGSFVALIEMPVPSDHPNYFAIRWQVTSGRLSSGQRVLELPLEHEFFLQKNLHCSVYENEIIGAEQLAECLLDALVTRESKTTCLFQFCLTDTVHVGNIYWMRTQNGGRFLST